jgi:hypothetical protein
MTLRNRIARWSIVNRRKRFLHKTPIAGLFDLSHFTRRSTTRNRRVKRQITSLNDPKSHASGFLLFVAFTSRKISINFDTVEFREPQSAGNLLLIIGASHCALITQTLSARNVHQMLAFSPEKRNPRKDSFARRVIYVIETSV